MTQQNAVQTDVDERLDLAIDRVHDLGIGSHFLCLAQHDSVWRKAVEAALASEKPMSKLLVGGARPADVWSQGLLRQRMLRAIKDDAKVFAQFAGLHPSLAEWPSEDGPDADDVTQMDPFVAVLAAYLFHPLDISLTAHQLERAADALEARNQGDSSELDCSDDESADMPTLEVVADEAGQLRAQLDEAKRTLQQRDQELKEARSKLKATNKDLNTRVSEISRKDRKATALKQDAATAAAERDNAVAAAKKMREERDESERENRRLRDQIKSSRDGQRTIEMRRADETKGLREANADLRERLSAGHDLISAFEKRIAAVEAELNEERSRRQELEGVLESLGFDDLAASSASLRSALDVLARFTEAAAAYVAKQEERERESIRLKEIAMVQQQAAEAARKAEEEAQAAWEQRAADRLTETEAALFPDGPVDHIIIDGHNFTGRVFGLAHEKRDRGWLERMADEMSARLEAHGASSCIHLTFDTPYQSNVISRGHGVKVYFRNNSSEGGADAQIAQLLREGNPRASYLVASTDLRHVWSDALEFIRDEGAHVDLVQVELLAAYLQALDEVVK